MFVYQLIVSTWSWKELRMPNPIEDNAGRNSNKDSGYPTKWKKGGAVVEEVTKKPAF